MNTLQVSTPCLYYNVLRLSSGAEIASELHGRHCAGVEFSDHDTAAAMG